jgi:hypothetical protein
MSFCDVLPLVILAIAAIIIIWLLYTNYQSQRSTQIANAIDQSPQAQQALAEAPNVTPESAEAFTNMSAIDPNYYQYLVWYYNQYPWLAPQWWSSWGNRPAPLPYRPPYRPYYYNRPSRPSTPPHSRPPSRPPTPGPGHGHGGRPWHREAFESENQGNVY